MIGGHWRLIFLDSQFVEPGKILPQQRIDLSFVFGPLDREFFERLPVPLGDFWVHLVDGNVQVVEVTGKAAGFDNRALAAAGILLDQSVFDG